MTAENIPPSPPDTLSSIGDKHILSDPNALENGGSVIGPTKTEDLRSLYLEVLSRRGSSEQLLFDIDLEYTKEEEAKVVKILDTRLFTAVLLSTFVLNVDRTNISNAVSAGLPADLGFTIDTVNSANQVYAAIFTFSTLLGGIAGKRFGPQRFIPFLMFSWGLVTLAHALINNVGGYYTVRSFIALTEGGVIPATLIYLGTFYKSTELVTRLSWFWGIQSIASAVSGLMAAGLLQLDGVRGLEGWKWLFIVDGIFTLLVAVWLVAYLPGDVTRTRGRWTKYSSKGWFDQRQQTIAVTRTIRDDPTKIKYLTTRVSWNDLKDALTDRFVWGHLILTMISLTPGTPLQTYLPTVIKTFNYSTFVANALTAPIYVLQCISMVLLGWHSDRTGDRAFHGLFGAVWFLVGFILLRALPATSGKGARYVGALVAGSWPQTHSLNIGWMTENTAGVGKRTVASGLIIGAANIYALWSSQIYRSDDSPLFRRGNDINIAFCAAAVVLWLLLKWQYVHANRTRAERTLALSEDERREVEARMEVDGSRGLLFRFTH
ncbi:hypothetical protein EHS25_005823 [Saitozyma podzolica]|uniref:Major facilitator superfamily (MFS) profile domain-containing protein n=1 Tax=Saitozyma podzolica TaxID=1890683 RepID=A0A427XVH6_9TREE|nr:hypothetical protein EHS25_005823 [Saitozyma podzolica]